MSQFSDPHGLNIVKDLNDSPSLENFLRLNASYRMFIKLMSEYFQE